MDNQKKETLGSILADVAIDAIKEKPSPTPMFNEDLEHIMALESWIKRNREWMHIDTVEAQILDDLLNR